MNRRDLLLEMLAGAKAGALIGWPVLGIILRASKKKRYACKIKTKGGSIVGNIKVTATDSDDAKAQVSKRYPGCTFLSVKEE